MTKSSKEPPHLKLEFNQKILSEIFQIPSTNKLTFNTTAEKHRYNNDDHISEVYYEYRCKSHQEISLFSDQHVCFFVRAFRDKVIPYGIFHLEVQPHAKTTLIDLLKHTNYLHFLIMEKYDLPFIGVFNSSGLRVSLEFPSNLSLGLKTINHRHFIHEIVVFGEPNGIVFNQHSKEKNVKNEVIKTITDLHFSGKFSFKTSYKEALLEIEKQIQFNFKTK